MLLVRNNIALYDNQGNRTFRGTAKFWRWAIKRFQPMLDSGAVRFVTDSERLADEYEELTGIRFQVLPHPCLIGLQAPSTPADESFGKTEKNSTSESTKSVRVFLPGPARYEKGADRLVEAAKLLSQQQDLSPIEMVFQWSDAFTLPNGSMLGPDDLPALNLSNVTFDVITKPLSSEAYHQQLLKADLIILPYRREVYFARISGVAVEAMMLGKPLLYTSDTWVDTIASQFDCGLSMDNDVAGVVEAISEAIANLDTMAQQSRGAAGDVASFFSAKSFTSKLLNS
ncbi:glycosyltransferase [Rhodopirellula bahusiensis]|uniref:glycosyltransferase n=1 Tax=Rhodopirellula bahusiensis TaxID=2014065 RepID=UPI0011798F34|nr:glycosyltransferase [Rhodopirellula bahusiensis]